MEPMHWEYMGALGGVIGIGWLVVVPMYRGWTPLNDKMVARVRRSIHMMAECGDEAGPPTVVATPSPAAQAALVATAGPSTSARSAIASTE